MNVYINICKHIILKIGQVHIPLTKAPTVGLSRFVVSSMTSHVNVSRKANPMGFWDGNFRYPMDNGKPPTNEIMLILYPVIGIDVPEKIPLVDVAGGV